MNFTIANSIILAGIIQGFIFGSIYLFNEKYKNQSTFFLALLIIVFSYNNLQFYLTDSRLISGKTMYATFYIPVGSLIPVFIYKYTLAFLQLNTTRISKNSFALYTPFVLFFLLAIVLKIDSIGNPNAVRTPFWLTVGKIQSISSLLYTLTLIVLSYIKVKQFAFKGMQEKYLYNQELRWLRRMLIMLFILSLLWAVALLKYVSNVEYRAYFTVLWIGLSIAIYWLGHIGIYKYGIREERKQIRAKATSTNHYGVKDETENGYIAKIEQIVVGKKTFLDPNFSAEMLADQLQISNSHLSKIFNAEMKVGFSEYINTLRVEEAKKHLQNPEFSNYTLVAIGFEAGFNSKTTFNTTFKKLTGQTPSQFRKNT